MPRPYDRRMQLEFRGGVIEWRGPSPFFFAVVPPDAAEVIADLAPVLTYGWNSAMPRRSPWSSPTPDVRVTDHQSSQATASCPRPGTLCI
jgi:hypothetical protein